MKLNQKSVKTLLLAAGLVTAVLLIVATIWVFAANVVVKGSFYPRKAEFLNLRGKELTAQDFEAIQKKLPNCDIYWDVPFQGKTYHENTSVLTVTKLTEQDVDALLPLNCGSYNGCREE